MYTLINMRSIAVLALLVLALYARSQAISARHGFPIHDERDYLRLARGVQERGGVLAFIKDHATGSYREDNRHPLLIAVLAPAMSGKAADFTRAKLVALGCAIFFIVAVGVAASKGRRPGEAALAAAGWAALSPAAAVYAQTLAPDLLFAGFFALAVSLAADAGMRARPWFVFGLTAGLAWLAKGNGHFLLIIPLVAALRHGRGAWRHPAPLAAGAGFITMGGFLLWRNLAVWGDPFHQQGKKSIWLDDENNFMKLMLSPDWDRVGAAWYWERHSLYEMASHAAHGAFAAAEAMLRAMAAGPSGTAAELASGAAFSALALLGLKRRWVAGDRSAVWTVAASAIPLWLAFAWLAKTGPSYVRFYLPMAAVLIGFAIEEVRARAPARWGAREGRGLLAAAAFVALAVDGKAIFSNPLRAWSVPPFWAPTSAWLNIHAGGGYLMDHWSFYSNWDIPPDVRRDVPLRLPAEDIRGYAQRLGARFAVVDLSLVGFDPYQEKFGPSDASGPTTFIGWPRCFRAAAEPNPLIVFGERCPDPGGP